MPAAEPTTLEELYELLHGAVVGTTPDQRLTLTAALLAAAGELVAHLGLTELELAQRSDVPGDLVRLEADHVAVAGTAVLFPAGKVAFSYDVVLTGTCPGAAALALDATPAATVTDWTFAGNFAADFPEYLGTSPAEPGEVVDPTLRPQPSFLPGAVFTTPAFRVATATAPAPTGLTFTGTLDVAQGSLKELAGLFLPAQLPAHGPVVVRPGTYPLVDLELDTGYSISKLADVSAAVTVVDADGATPAATDFALVGQPTAPSIDDITISAPLLQGRFLWRLTGETHDPVKYSVASGLGALAAYAGMPLTLPTGFDALSQMYLRSVSAGFRPSAVPALDQLGFTIATDPARNTLWSIPILGLAFQDLGVQWSVIGLTSDEPTMIGTVSGVFVVGSGPDAARLDAAVDVSGVGGAQTPDAGFTLSLDPTTELPVKELFRVFTGQEVGIPLTITDLLLEGRTGTRSLQFVVALEPTWDLKIPGLEVKEVTLAFRSAPNAFTATLGLEVTLLELGFLVGATYRGDGKGWLLSGGLLPASQGAKLAALAPGYLPDDLPAGLGDIELRNLTTSFDTTSTTFTFDGTVGWPFTLLGLDVDLEAQLSLTKRKETAPEGFVRGALTIDAFRAAVTYAFGVKNNRTITFEIAWKGATLTCIASENAKGETILRANLGGVSFGDLVAWLAGLGGAEVTLSAPWDVLYQVTFDALWLEVNLTTKAIGARYDVGLDLGFVRVDTVGLTYQRRAGAPSLDLSITGAFAGTEYGADDPLGWDVINDPAPAPPGKADALLDLRFLALGQNVAFRDTSSFTRIADVLAALEADFAPVDPDASPLEQLSALRFSGDGNWLIGVDFTLMSAVSLSGIFADPSLYGVRIGLAGERVKSLAGLELEILYRKISDTVGVYHIELTLPEAMRQLTLGVVSVTIPTITVDIYTNGNFRVDLGFPADGDWSRSFCLQAGYFIGYGGFYFALLDGTTSSKVPAITNGAFSPVIEFGVGLQVGVGRTLDKGVLKAGATLTVQAIVEGVLGWFNPDDRSQPSETYYWIQGTAAIVGNVYGSVDFVVLKATVSITVAASATLTLEAYRPAEVELVVRVEVSASLTFLFFTLSFSFSTSLDLSFTLGSGSTPPWRIAADDPVERTRLLAQRTSHRVAPPRPADLLRALRPRPRSTFDWTPQLRGANAAPVDVDLVLLPMLTPAVVTPEGEPATQIVLSLLVPTSTPTHAEHADEVLRVTADAPAEAPFNLLAGGVLRWAIGALSHRLDGDRVTIEELEEIASFLAVRANRDATFTYEAVTGLIAERFRLVVSNPLGPDGRLYDARSDVPRGATATPVQGAMFPMIPEIAMTPQGLAPVTFWNHHGTNADYRTALETYYDQLAVDAGAGAAREPSAGGPVGCASGPPPGAPEPADPLRPVSTIVFSDWFALVAQQSVQLAADLLDAYPYRPTGTESLDDVVGDFTGVPLTYRVRPGDTLGSVAARFGLAAEELRPANGWLRAAAHRERLPAGATLEVHAGTSVAKIAHANSAYPLNPGAVLGIGGVRYSLRDGDTLASVAARFGFADPARLLTETDGVNARSTTLPQPGALLAIPAASHRVTADELGPDDALDRIAAVFYVRARQRSQDVGVREQIAWYVGAIGQLNPQGFAGSVQVPQARLDGGRIVDRDDPTTYVVRPGDTVTDVAAAFALLQLAGDDPAWRAFRGRVTVAPPLPLQAGSIVTLPPCDFPTLAGDTFAAVVEALLLSPTGDLDPLLGGLQALARANASRPVLAARAVLALPEIAYVVRAGDTLAALAQQFALSLDELAASIAAAPGLLAPYDGVTALTVPDVADVAVDALVEDLARLGSFNGLSTIASRFVLSGMRAPAPGPTGAPEGDLRGLFEVVGQQFPAPGATGATYGIDVANGTGASWLGFDAAPGKRANGADEDGVHVTLTPAFFAAHTPSPVLDPRTMVGPTAMPMYDLVPPRYPLQQSVAWQPATAVPLPGPTGGTGSVSGVAGVPALWRFPQGLLDRLPAGAGPTATTPPYELVATPTTTRSDAPERRLERYSWATAIPLTVARAVDASGVPVPGTYELVGTGQSGRDLLRESWQALDALGPGAELYLLREAGPSDAGLISDALDAQRTFVLRTNLSTETHSGGFALGANRGTYYARIADPAAFLRNVWEASVTGTGGFHLTYADAAGRGLSDELFAADGTASLVALLMLDHQRRTRDPVRGLFAFNNCAVLDEGLDPSATRLQVQPVAATAADLYRAPRLPPGLVGFGLVRENPGGATGPADTTRRLHSLVGYQVAGCLPDFDGSHESLPLGPVDDVPAWLPAPPGPTHAYWAYHQVVPVAQFGTVNDCPRSPALPPAADNPYRGITGPTGPGAGGRPLSAAKLDLAYHDVYGNTTRATRPAGSLDVPVGYADELIAVAAWPGSGFAYRFEPADGGGPRLRTTLSLQVDRYLPGGGATLEAAARTAATDAARYRALFYQLQQRDVGFALGANLGSVTLAGDDLGAALRGFVTKAKAFADTTATLRQATARTLTAGETLAAAATRLAATPAALLEANADADAAALLPQTYVQPHLLAAPAMATLAGLAEHPVSHEATPTADPPTPVTVARANLTQPLTPGNVLRTAPQTSPPIPEGAETASLRDLAASLMATVYADVADPDGGAPIAVGLVVENWTAEGLIADGVVLDVDGVALTTSASTFALIHAVVVRERPALTRGDLAAALAGVEGLLVAGRTLTFATLVVPAPPPPTGPAPAAPRFALRDVPDAAGPLDALATRNRAVTTFFAVGAPLLLGVTVAQAVAGDTPRSLARAAAVSLAQLAAFNGDTALGGDIELLLPDVAFLPAPDAAWAAFTPAVADGLGDVAAAVGATPLQVADANRELPGVLRTGAVVTAGETPVTAGPLDSLQSVFLRADAASWEGFVARLAEPAGAGILRPESAVLVPLPAVPGSDADAPAIDAYAARLRVAPEALLAANVALPGFLRAGATVRGGAAEEISPPPEVPVGPHDTVLSVQRRLEALGADATLAALVTANAGRTGLLTAGTRVLLPPAPTELVSPFGAVLPPAGSSGESAIVFPVDVWVDLTRNRGLVHPDFADTEAIWHARSALVPQLVGSADAKVAQRAFATAFEAAFAAQPLKVAVTGEAGAGAAKGRMWAVNFGGGGVSRLAVDAVQPMFYALQPLSTTPWGGELSFPTYASGKGLCADVTKRFQGVDVDAWLRDLLGAIDLALTPGYSVPAFRAGPVSAAVGAAAPEPPRDAAAALRTPAAPPPVPDPLSGPVGLETAAQISRPVLGALASGTTGCTGPTASGPLDYERLVAAKASIAGALREQVTPIVAAPGATGPWQTDWAREALYQRMLVRLGDGYDTSAIVELPVDVTSPLVTPPPGATGAAPPRVSGKVGPVAHRLAEAPAAATLDEAAGRLGVSAPYLASVLGDVQGILEIGAEIAGQPVGDHDTINQVAARVSIPTDPSAPGYWEPWTAFVAGFAGRPVLVPGAGLPLSALTRMVHGGETLTTIATFFSRDAVSVGRANQDRPGLVRPGPLTAGDDYPHPYAVTAADTLVTVAAGLSTANPGPPALTVDALCDLLADVAPFLAVDRTLAMVTVLPGLSLSTSKVSLGRVGSRDGVAPPLTFLLNVKDEAQNASLLLNLEYTINELEYAISDVAATGGYQASSWLTFVLALDGSDGGVDARAVTAIPQIQVPIPLRAFPPPSVLAGQSGIPSDPGSSVPAQARRWDYRFDVQTRKAAQDTDHLLVRFGEQTGGLLGATSLAGLLRWLAAYVDAAPTLSDDLARLPQLRPGAVDPVAAHAFQALSFIAAGVGHALSARSFAAPAGPTAVQTLAYEMTALTDGTQLKTLRLTPEAPGPTGASASWPDVLVASATAPTGQPGPDAGFLPMEGTAGRYRYPGGIVAADAQTYRFRFDERDVIRNRNARGSIAVTRNDRLVAAGPLGPTGAPGPVPTSEGFIYRTPFVGFQEPLVPLLEADATIDVAALGVGPVPRPLRDHVLALLAAATDVAPGSAAAPADIELAVAYGSLVGDMLIRTPVLLVPARTLTGAEVGAFASELTTSLTGWHRASQIASDAGLLAFELTVFATDQGSDAARRPILRFTDLRLSLADIAWPPDTKDER